MSQCIYKDHIKVIKNIKFYNKTKKKNKNEDKLAFGFISAVSFKNVQKNKYSWYVYAYM